MTTHPLRRSWWPLLALLGVAACAAPSPRQATLGPTPTQRVIRVGVSPDAPPVAFMRDGRIVGIEPDLAQALVDQFQRPLALIPLRFDELIPALLDGRVDVIMSGMSVTPARQVRVAFSQPYMRSGLLAASTRSAASKYRSRDMILNSGANVGVRMGSTAEGWVQANMATGTVVPYPSILDAARELAQGRLDLIISDAPQVAWAVSEHSGMLQVLPPPLTQEDIAWAFRREDGRLREAADVALAGMQQDGRLRAILQRWIPYLDRLERATR